MGILQGLGTHMWTSATAAWSIETANQTTRQVPLYDTWVRWHPERPHCSKPGACKTKHKNFWKEAGNSLLLSRSHGPCSPHSSNILRHIKQPSRLSNWSHAVVQLGCFCLRLCVSSIEWSRVILWGCSSWLCGFQILLDSVFSSVQDERAEAAGLKWWIPSAHTHLFLQGWDAFDSCTGLYQCLVVWTLWQRVGNRVEKRKFI